MKLARSLFVFVIILLSVILIGWTMPVGMQDEGAKKGKLVKLIRADNWIGKPGADGKKEEVIVGNVVFEHEGAMIYSDTAVIDVKMNIVRIRGNAHVWINDTVSLYGDKIIYDGNTKIADVLGNVRLVDGSKTLYTKHLIFDRNTNLAYYPDKGKVVDGDNTIVSKIGYYFTDVKDFFFKTDVVVTNPDFVMTTDTLFYNTDNKLVKIVGPTEFRSKDGDTTYSERGWYDTNTDIAKLKRNVYVGTDTQVLTADSVYYERNRDFAQGFRDVLLQDTVEKILLYSEFVEYCKSDGYGLAYDKILVVNVDKDTNDSLFMHCDTLRWTFDADNKTKLAKAYYHTKFYRSDFQGVCDSMVYSGIDSTLVLYMDPVLWSDKNQITADSIKTFFSGQVDSTYLYNTAFVVSQYDIDDFNQIKGRLIKGYFRNNDLDRIMVLGNAETLYYIDDEDSTLVGINKTQASRLKVTLKDREISKLTFYDKPDGGIYPEDQFPMEDKKLKNFRWLEFRRPLKKDDVFIWK